MATARKSTKPAAETIEEVEEEVTAEATPKQIVNEAIGRVVESLGIDVQKNRYKAMRAIAFQAFVEAIENDDFDRLVDDAIANVDNLPSGWEIERSAKDEAPAKPAAKKAPVAKKAPAAKATAAKPATRKRPTR